MPNARITQLADTLVTALQTSVTTEATVARVYSPTTDFKNVTGRFVDVYTLAYSDGGYIDRSENYHDSTITVVVRERYEEPGLPTNAWMDERIQWVEEKIYDYLGDDRRDDVLENWSLSIEVVSVYDWNHYKENKMFYSEITVTFRQAV